MDRQRNAYLTPAAVILGLALHNWIGSAYLLTQKVKKAGSGWIWRCSLVTLAFILGFIICQMIILDFITSPYVVPGFLQFLCYVFHLLCTIGISCVLMLRLSVFYASSSALMVTMFVLCGLVIIGKAVGDGFGMIMSISVMKNEYLRYEQHPYFVISQMTLGIGAAIDMCFSILGSVGFLYALYALDKGIGKSFVKDVLFEHDGYRLIAICILHMFICTFGLYVSGGRSHTFITHTGLYIPSWAFALELRTFLELSYVTAKEIIMKQGKTTSSDLHTHTGNSHDNSEVRDPEFGRPRSPRDSPDMAKKYRAYQTIPGSSNDSSPQVRTSSPQREVQFDSRFDVSGQYRHSKDVQNSEVAYSTPSDSSPQSSDSYSYGFYDALNDYASSSKASASSKKKVPQYF